MSNPSKDAQKPKRILYPDEPWLGTVFTESDDYDSEDERITNDIRMNGPLAFKVCCCDARLTKAWVGKGKGNVRFRKGCICYDNKDEDYVPDMPHLSSCCSGKDTSDDDEGSLSVKPCSDENDTNHEEDEGNKTLARAI